MSSKAAPVSCCSICNHQNPGVTPTLLSTTSTPHRQSKVHITVEYHRPSRESIQVLAYPLAYSLSPHSMRRHQLQLQPLAFCIAPPAPVPPGFENRPPLWTHRPHLPANPHGAYPPPSTCCLPTLTRCPRHPPTLTAATLSMPPPPLSVPPCHMPHPLHPTCPAITPRPSRPTPPAHCFLHAPPVMSHVPTRPGYRVPCAPLSCLARRVPHTLSGMLCDDPLLDGIFRHLEPRQLIRLRLMCDGWI